MTEKMHAFHVDVDNPKWKPAINSIEAHSRIADYYKFRPPYLGEFFQRSAKIIGLKKTDKLLDLCCGRGEIADGFSDYVDQVKAIDGSNRMLEKSIPRENISYYLADINNDDLSFLGMVDHIVLGSAIHWVSGKKILEITSRDLNPKGGIFVCHTLFKFNKKSYYEKLELLNKKFGKKKNVIDLLGMGKLDSCGFTLVNGVSFAKSVSMDVNYLYRNQLSYAYHDFDQVIFDKEDDYKREFYKTLLPLSQNSKFGATLVNWGGFYMPR